MTNEEIRSAAFRSIFKATSVSKEDIESKNRNDARVFARHLYFYLMRQHTDMTLAQIANSVNRTCHSTAIHGISSIDYLLCKNGRGKVFIKKCNAALDYMNLEIEMHTDLELNMNDSESMMISGAFASKEVISLCQMNKWA